MSEVRLSIVIVNYRTPGLVIDCLGSIETEIDHEQDRVIVVDNASGDGSLEQIVEAIEERGWGAWCRAIDAGANAGFSAGNNVGVAAQAARYYFLLNSDTIVRPGAIGALIGCAEADPESGMFSPRLEWPDGEQQVGCFRVTTPLTELARAASVGVLDRVLRGHVSSIPVEDERTEPGWLSFAAVLIRREVWEQIGPMDDGYFMYYEDTDYGRRAASAGWGLRRCHQSRIVHLQGGSTTKREAPDPLRRLPPFVYRARARYFAKFYGPTGPVLANACWTLGYAVSLVRRVLPGGRRPPRCQWRDIWHGVLRPMANDPVRFTW